MSIFDSRTARVLVTILLFVGIGAFCWGARHTLIAFLFAIFFAYLLDPLVAVAAHRLRSHSRGWAILIVYVLLGGVLSLLFYLLGPSLAHEARHLSNELPGLFEKLASGQIAHQIGSRRGWSLATQARVDQFLANHQGAILKGAQDVGTRVAELATNAIWLVLIPILAIFFLRDGPKFAEDIIEVTNRRRQRILLRGIFDDLHHMLAAYIRAQLLLAAISIAVYCIVMSIMRVPYALVLGVIGGMLEFIPVVGPLIAAISIFGVAFLTNYSHLLVLLLFLGAWRLVQDYVNSPHILGSRVELHPLAALFGVLVGAEIAGVIGVYLSIPIIASLRILWNRWRNYEGLPSHLRAPVTSPSDEQAA